MASHVALREHVFITFLREPGGCLTFQQLVDRLHAEPDWTTVKPIDLRAVLYELTHEPGARIECGEDGHYCRRRREQLRESQTIAAPAAEGM